MIIDYDRSNCNSKTNFKIQVPADATDFLKGLLRKNPQARLGSGAGGAEEVMSHQFFSEIDWAKLYRREIKVSFAICSFFRLDRL